MICYCLIKVIKIILYQIFELNLLFGFSLIKYNYQEVVCMIIFHNFCLIVFLEILIIQLALFDEGIMTQLEYFF